MHEVIFKWFQENYPELVIFLIVAWTTWRVSRIYGRLEKAEEKCVMMDGTNNDIKDIKKDIGNIFLDLRQLIMFLGSTIDKFPKEFFVSKSPIQLNEVGLDLLEKFGGKKFIDDNEADLVEMVNDHHQFKSNLDVQNGALSLLYTCTDRNDFIPIKNWIYNNPVYKIGANEINFSLSLAMNIMGIYLRDKYFDKYGDLRDIDPVETLEPTE